MVTRPRLIVNLQIKLDISCGQSPHNHTFCTILFNISFRFFVRKLFFSCYIGEKTLPALEPGCLELPSRLRGMPPKSPKALQLDSCRASSCQRNRKHSLTAQPHQVSAVPLGLRRSICSLSFKNDTGLTFGLCEVGLMLSSLSAAYLPMQS